MEDFKMKMFNMFSAGLALSCGIFDIGIGNTKMGIVLLVLAGLNLQIGLRK